MAQAGPVPVAAIIPAVAIVQLLPVEATTPVPAAAVVVTAQVWFAAMCPSRSAGSDAVLRAPAVSGAASHPGVERDSNGVKMSRTDTSLLNVALPAHESRENVQVRNVQPEKRSFISFLRHPVRKPAMKDPEAMRGPLCFKGRCPVSPPTQGLQWQGVQESDCSHVLFRVFLQTGRDLERRSMLESDSFSR